MDDRRKPLRDYHAIQDLTLEQSKEILRNLPVLADNELEREVSKKLEELEAWFSERGLHYVISVLGNDADGEGPATITGAAYLNESGITLTANILRLVAMPHGERAKSAEAAVRFIQHVTSSVRSEANQLIMRELRKDPKFSKDFDALVLKGMRIIQNSLERELGEQSEPHPEEEPDGPGSDE